MIKIFFHAWGNNNRGHLITKELISNIHISGLYEAVDVIHVFLIGSAKYVAETKELIKRSGKKFEITKEAPDVQAWEQFTLCSIRDFVGPEDKFLYIHTKGASHNSDDMDKMDEWRHYMCYYCMSKFRRCLSLLDEYDTVGVLYREIPVPHWSGAFYWVTGKHWLGLPPNLDPNDRWLPELIYPFTTRPKYLELAKWTSPPQCHSHFGKPPNEWIDK